MRYYVIGCAVAMAVVFTVAAVGKARDRAGFGAFVTSVRHLLPIGSRTAGPVAAVMLATEMLVPPLVLLRPRAGLALGAAVLTVFALAILAAVRRGVREPCRCFGVSTRQMSGVDALRNVLLAALAAGATAAAGPHSGPALVGTAHAGGVALAGFGGVTLAIVVIAFDDIIDLFAPGPSASPPAAEPGARMAPGERV